MLVAILKEYGQVSASTYGVARLETSLTMMSIPRCRATPILEERLPRSIPTTLAIFYCFLFVLVIQRLEETNVEF